MLHMLNTVDYHDYRQRARGWAWAVWHSWVDEHTRIRSALAAAWQR